MALLCAAAGAGLLRIFDNLNQLGCLWKLKLNYHTGYIYIYGDFPK